MLDPGRSIRLSSSERSYQIVLLSVEHDAVRVRVTSTQIGKPEQTEKTPSRVSVLETTTSCFAELQRIVGPLLTSEKVKVKWDSEGCRFVEKGFFGATLLRLSSVHLLQNGRRSRLFRDGRWENLRIEVFAQPYLAIAKSIADAYTERTNKEVAILKEF